MKQLYIQLEYGSITVMTADVHSTIAHYLSKGLRIVDYKVHYPSNKAGLHVV